MTLPVVSHDFIARKGTSSRVASFTSSLADQPVVHQHAFNAL